ncbi:MAG: hypothetical protein AAF479_05310 [Pseudomonadota bacterium]
MIIAPPHGSARARQSGTGTMIEIFKELIFDAPHQLGANVEPGHPYANIHRHSFKAEV